MYFIDMYIIDMYIIDMYFIDMYFICRDFCSAGVSSFLFAEDSRVFQSSRLQKDKVANFDCLNMQMFYYRKADIRYHWIECKIAVSRLKS